MATIASALRDKVLEEYALPEYEGRQPIRTLYVASELFDWVDVTEQLYVENWSQQHGARTRFEHLQQMFADFRCDKRPLVGDLNRVQPTRNGLWKMQCPGLRVYGWVPSANQFVA